MDYLWIFVAIFAAALQTFRSAFQKRMIPEIGKFGATYIRFIYALPFTFLIFIFWFYILDNLIPELNEKAILYCFVGALCQVLFTLLLMIIFLIESILWWVSKIFKFILKVESLKNS